MKKINWWQYLIELIVVIIGISIAFSLENWREHQKEHQITKEYLQSLKADLMLDSVSFKQLIGRTNYSMRCATSVRQTIENQKIEKADSFFMNMFSMYMPLDFQASRSTIDALENSGQLNLIHNFELKKQIVSLYQHYKMIDESEEQRARGIENYYTPHLADNYDYDAFFFSRYPMSLAEKEVLMKKALKDLTLKNMSTGVNTGLFYSKQYYQKGLYLGSDLVRAIDYELEKL